MPELEKLIAMSRLFGVTVGGLLGVESPDEERDTSSQGAAEAADSDMASEAEAPAHELTDRELTAVEAIAEKYLAAQQARQNRWRWPLVILAGGSILALLVAGSALRNQLQQIRAGTAGQWRPPLDSRSSPSPANCQYFS